MDDFVNIEAKEGQSYSGEITYKGERLRNVSRLTVTLEPNALVVANLEVYASLSDVRAVGHMFPVWECIESHPNDDTECLFLLRDGSKAVGFIDSGYNATHFIPLTWLNRDI